MTNELPSRRRPAATREPQLAARAVHPLLSGLRALGQDPAPLLALVGLEESALADPDARIPMRTAIAFLAHAVERTGDPDLSLHLAERAELGAFDVHVYAVLSSPTLHAGYQRLVRYQRLIHETSELEFAVGAAQSTLRHRLPGGLAVPRQSAEFIVACWVRAGRAAIGQDFAPIEVRFAHPAPPAVQEHARFFRAPVRFASGENAIVVSNHLLDTPCLRADLNLLAVLDRYALDRLAAAPSPAASSRVADAARSALVNELQEGQPPTATRLAERLRMSERSLNRTLAAEGTSYRELLAQLRLEVAARHLAQDRLAIAEIAFLLGFSELSAFYRAFKRWTGRTPAEYRAEARAANRPT
ncbi:MAG TPA: AraC family transcriptional regulator [Candidatus Udaeobacter sp.]|nr:AraC family transcriptional regulator [Candidatus Udaeobacter sp.]